MLFSLPSASLHTEGETYEEGLALLRERGYDVRPGRVRTIVLVEVNTAAPLISPAYEGDATEQAVAAKWERHYEELARRRRARSHHGP